MKLTIVFLGLLISLPIFAQNDWQQTVNYKIDVKLNDVEHSLDGNIEMEYINNSPEALSFIYIHLWPNAYSNDKTALAKQLYQDGNDLLRFGADSIKGGINKLDFKVNGLTVNWALEKNIDIAKVQLASPLPSGKSIVISTPFHVQLPSGKVSRMGHIGQSYQITQWYPKPAVFDKNGWHAIPYLNQGEFYSEYGSYDVTITLPANYVVGATGDLQTQSEIDFMNEMAEKTAKELQTEKLTKRPENTFPPSSENIKTIRYVQQKVHDFGWFADKRFRVLKGEVELPHSKRKVTTWALFTPRNTNLWKDAPEYIKDGTYYYSLWNGDYPYNQVTAVDGTISAGGGMEYPNVTVIGNANSAEELEVVIVHEVGHNWFYGILGSNERDHGWMDEGLNTLNEIRYIQTKYPNNTRLSDMALNGSFHMNDLDYLDQADIQFQLMTRFGEDQPIETKSADFYSLNYSLVMYQKTGLVFHYLKSYLGDVLFDECMSAYFEKWKFRHPQPEDLRAVFESKTGKNLDWFFNDLIQTTNHIDYKLSKVKTNKDGQTEITVKNVGQVNGPIPVSVRNGANQTTYWLDPNGNKKRTILMAQNPTKVQIDSLNNIPEINRNNNTWTSEKLFKKMEPLKLEFFDGDVEANYNNLFWTPVVGFNSADKFMAGIAIHNLGAPVNPFRFYVAPMFSFGRHMVSGIADAHYNFLPKKGIKQSVFGVSARSFKMDTVIAGNKDYYYAITPYLQLKLGNRGPNKPWSNEILIKTVFRQNVLASREQTMLGGYLDYMLNFTRVDHEWETHVKNDHYENITLGTQATRSMITSTYRFRYLKNKMTKWIELRVFAGKIWSIQSDASEYDNTKFALSGNNGNQDLFFDDLFFNRIPGNATSVTQRADNMGGFRSTSSFGNASKWMTTANLFWEAPIKIQGLGIFADAGLFSSGGTIESVWNLGVGFKIRKIFQLQFPIAMSQNILNNYTSSNYLNRIRFSLNVNIQSHPFRLRNLF
ncbi:MAG: M1 family metallopeptidase [Crocinitomicaceae bacterium]